MTLAAAGGPSWTDILTAIGTVGAVIVALGIALYTDWRAGDRIKAEHERSDRVLGEERRRAASESAGQREHERAALDEERAYSRRQLEEERRLALEREQLAEAYAVQIGFGERHVGDGPSAAFCSPVKSDVKQLAVIVLNRSSSTITRVEAQFCLGNSMIPHDRYERVSTFRGIPEVIRGDYAPSPERAMSGVLTPWDFGIRFETDGIHERHLAGPYPVVRWTDRWGARWEHKKGVMRQIREDEPWEP